MKKEQKNTNKINNIGKQNYQNLTNRKNVFVSTRDKVQFPALSFMIWFGNLKVDLIFLMA